jgi:hypothetical protein
MRSPERTGFFRIEAKKPLRNLKALHTSINAISGEASLSIAHSARADFQFIDFMIVKFPSILGRDGENFNILFQKRNLERS